jgi:DNA (cytosine-5)-methyltransferase 1
LSREITVDLFAGGGGASEGVRWALGRDPDVAINHDRVAIAMHKANHPGTWHLIQDIWEVPPRWATRRRPVGLLWASPDCKHFSKAKGRAPKRDREIRSLAWVVEKWARDVRPRVVILENVEEFSTWGPLDSEGAVIPEHAGDTYRAFIRRLRRLGYRVETRELRACDYGAPTIRKRLFMVARCDGAPIVWPEPTHGPGLLPYRTAAEIIDWSIPCPSIFERKRPLVENTLRRIAEGIRRYVIEAAEPFIVTYYGPKKGEQFRGLGMEDVLPTQTTENRFGLVVPTVAPFLTEHANGSGQRNFDLAEPLRTQCANVKGGHFALVMPHIQRQFGCGVGTGMGGPIGTVTAGGMGKTALVSAFLAKHFTGVVGHKIDKPAGTITTRDHHSLVTSHLIKMRGTCKHGQAVTDPAPTITSGGTHVGEVRAFLMKYYSHGVGQALTDPLATAPTKDRFGLITVMVKGEPYIITDIGMRMLSPRELFRAQGFPDSYRIDIDVDGKHITKTAQVRCCGNSVCPPIAEALVTANAGNINLRVANTTRCAV